MTSETNSPPKEETNKQFTVLQLEESYVDASERIVKSFRQNGQVKLPKTNSCRAFTSPYVAVSRDHNHENKERPMSGEINAQDEEIEYSFSANGASLRQSYKDSRVKVKAAAIQIDDHGVDDALKSINEGLDNLIKGMAKKNMVIPKEEKPLFFVSKPFLKMATPKEKVPLSIPKQDGKKTSSSSPSKTKTDHRYSDFSSKKIQNTTNKK